ncbi:MAG TPA: class I tRNA ligase family protein, partial [Nostoc sp.]|uniref:class I tRNA ligase family protein n=1 Tax=Nostoc sp. TaxID=1180 RepID=UPI002D54B41F
WTKVYRDWLVKLTDWCISRQLWWGHQIPAWYAISETDGQITDNTPFVVAKSETEAWEKARSQFGENVKLEQDPDVLDTWFSSGLWPFSTLGWPEQTQDLATYYPTTTLVTGFDIIFFWVARMTMMAGHFTGQMPFQTVYIHGLVLDEKGQKMSKTKGNGIDPLLLIDKYGTDALRYTLIREVAGAGQDIRLEYDRKKDESASVEASRNFANKLWNAARFVMMNLDGQTPQQLGNPVATELSDRWIISRYHQVVKQTTNDIDNYGLGEAAKGLYEFIWGDFCDQYIELAKSRLQADADPVSRRVAQQTLGYILEGIMKLLHPFMPHITEEIWQTLTQQPADSPQTLPLQIYPQVDANLIDSPLEEQFELLIATIRTIRNLRAEADIKPGVKVTANLQTESEKERQILTAGQDYIKDLAKVETLTITDKQENQTVAAKKPQRGLKTIGLIIVAIVFGRLGLAAGNAIDDIPIVGTFFELVGFGYTAWFVSQNLLTAQARLRLWSRFFPQKELEQSQEPENAIAGVIGTIQVLIPLSGVVDIEAVRAKLEKSLSKAEAEVQSLSTRLNNPSFIDRARADVVQGARDALAEAQKQAEILRERLKGLS